MRSLTVAIDGSLDANVHAPVDVEDGGLRVIDVTLSLLSEISPKVPSTGGISATVSKKLSDVAAHAAV